MATDYLKHFIDGEAILASETNANNQYLLEQIVKNADFSTEEATFAALAKLEDEERKLNFFHFAYARKRNWISRYMPPFGGAAAVRTGGRTGG